MALKTKGNGLKQVRQKIEQIDSQIIAQGRRWVKESTQDFNETLLTNLASQGRDGGQPPPLSSATLRIYEIKGEPDGSAIAEHVINEFTITPSGASGTVGVLKGQPTVVARVQDRGATIKVTDAMRGFLSAAYGIHLRADTTHINVPGRHFWENALKESTDRAKRKLKALARHVLG